MASTLLQYYQENDFNPVPISLGTGKEWKIHLEKRRNLYENHLGIPFHLLAGKKILEFGCNSGENALVAASFGADLTLVEPNEKALTRLRTLFERFNLTKQISAIYPQSIGSFIAREDYDLIIAEGFIYTLPDKEKILKKICSLLKQGGIGVISFNDRYGIFLEMLRRTMLRRFLELSGHTVQAEPFSEAAARSFFYDDFSELHSSRPFTAWWKDTLINPFVEPAKFWSYGDLLPLLHESNCYFYGSSPLWHTTNHWQWYKNMRSPAETMEKLLDNWLKVFHFFIMGRYISNSKCFHASPELISAVGALIGSFSDLSPSWEKGHPDQADVQLFLAYLRSSGNGDLAIFSDELEEILLSLETDSPGDLLKSYHTTKLLRSHWGVPYHHLAFQRCNEPIQPDLG